MRCKSVILAMVLMASSLFADPIEADYIPAFKPEGHPLEGLIITIDAGHGGSAHQPGYTGSARGVNSRVVEGHLNIKTTIILDHFLRGAGARVHMTRRDDRKVTPGDSGRTEELGGRTKLAEETTSHLFLALHHNSAPRATADGVVVLIWPTDSHGAEQELELQFADILETELKELVHWNEDFDPYINEHPLVANNDIPSAVIEFGFLSNPEFDAWVSQPRAATIEAEGVYKAVERMWREHRDALEAKRRELFPDAAEMNAQKSASGLENMAKSLWPFDVAPATAKDANHLIGLYERTVPNDRTTFLVEVEAEKAENGFRLYGQVNHIRLKNAIVGMFEALGVAVDGSDIRVLPAENLGDQKYGVVQIPMALTYALPKEGIGVQTQLLLGEPVWLLDMTADETYYQLQGGEGYVGWVRSEAVRRLDAEEFKAWLDRPVARVQRPVYINDFLLPTGAQLPYELAEGGPISEKPIILTLPRGVRATGEELLATVGFDDVRWRTDDPGRRAAEAALEVLYIPYLFGGRSPLGLDCSGLTGTSYAAVGITLPRDAFQQAIVGRLVATPWNRENLRPGDLLFFIDNTGRVIHTGLSIGGQRFVHCSPPQVQINSFDPADPLYSAGWTEAFATARRLMP